MRFELIDRVVERGPDRLVAVKCVTTAEEYLADHFPSFPVLPGVLMLEAMVQAAREFVGDAFGPLVVAEVRNVRYGNMVRPGQSLRVEVTPRGPGEPAAGWEFQGVGSVDGHTAVQGRFRLTPLSTVA